MKLHCWTAANLMAHCFHSLCKALMCALAAGIAVGVGSSVAVPLQSGCALTCSLTDNSGELLEQRLYLKSNATQVQESYGWSVDIHGDTLVVGAPATGVNPNLSGLAYVYERLADAEWQLSQVLSHPDADVDDHFGWSVAISGDVIVVGAEHEGSSSQGVGGDPTNNSLPGSGAAYVYRRGASGWVLEAYLKQPSPQFGAAFGQSVDVCGDRIVVGAPDSTMPGSTSLLSYGAGYVYFFDGANWFFEAEMRATYPGFNERFGMSVAISGDLVAFGAPGDSSDALGINGPEDNDDAGSSGAVFVYQLQGVWAQSAYIKAAFPDNAEFGASIDLSEDLLVVGAPSEGYLAYGVDDTPTAGLATSGAAYAFRYDEVLGVWAQEAYIKATNTFFEQYFGRSVACDSASGLILVGAPREDGAGVGVNSVQDPPSFSAAFDNYGSAYLYSYSGSQWNIAGYVKSTNPDLGDEFGTGVVLSGDVLVVGAPFEDGASMGFDGDQLSNSADRAGAVYVFDVDGVDAQVQSWTLGSNVSSLSASAPRLGLVWQAVVDLSSTGHTAALVYFYGSPGQFGPVFNGQWILVGSQFPIGQLSVLPAPAGLLDVVLPNELALNGSHVSCQAVHLGGVMPPRLTNALDLTLGN